MNTHILAEKGWCAEGTNLAKGTAPSAGFNISQVETPDTMWLCGP